MTIALMRQDARVRVGESVASFSPLCQRPMPWIAEKERETKKKSNLFRVERTSSTVFFPIPSFVLLSFPVCLCVYYLNSKSREDFVTLNYGGGGGKNRG